MIRAAASTLIEEEERAPPRRLLVLYLVGAISASIVAVLLALAARLELLTPTQTIMSAAVFGQVTLLRDALFILGVALPSIAALGHLLLAPLPPGAERLRRLERLGLMAHALGGLLLLGGALFSSWSTLLHVAGAGVAICLGGTLQSVAFIARTRAPLPRGAAPSLFASGLFWTSVAELLALPLVAAILTLLIVERVGGRTLWHGAGADPALFEHWLRLGLRPLPYLALVPAVAAIGDAFAQRTRSLLAVPPLLLLLGGAAAFARQFGQHEAAVAAVTSLFSLALLVPATVAIGNWLVQLPALIDGAPRRFAILFVVLFAELAASAVPLGLADVGPSLHVNVFAAAHHELLFAALGFAMAASLHRRWGMLAAGRGGAYDERRAVTGALLAFCGVQLAVAAQLAAGTKGMPVAFEYPSALRGHEAIAGVGWLLVALGAATVGGNLLRALRRR